MTRSAVHINDAAITLLNDQHILYREPGFALLDDKRALTGSEAFANARIHPRRIQHQHWASLTTLPLSVQGFTHLTPADLVSLQLERMWRAGGAGVSELVIAVPASMQKEHLGLLLGIAEELKLPVSAMVDSAVAATRRHYVDAVPVHIDISLHATTLVRIAQPGQARLDRVETLPDCGLYALYDLWLNVVAEAFVRQSRFDPLHTAETEQMLLDNLGAWLAQAARSTCIELQLRYGGGVHKAEIESLALTGAAAPVYQAIASKLRALYRAEDAPAIQVTDRIARLPGLTDMLKARVGGEVFVLEPGATARGALARCRNIPAGEGGISLSRQLPWDQSPVAVEREETGQVPAGLPTHLLFGSQAFVIDESPLLLGSQKPDSERGIVLGADMPGISRRHCSLRLLDGRCILEDHSRYGTFLNGHRIDGSTVLQVGDSLRVGSPGYEMQLITTDPDYGA